MQADRSVRNLYKLHSVLVHSGGVHGGHYYAYIRPDGKTWLKFDDTAVTIEDGSKALEEQFGGEDEPGGSPAGRVQVRVAASLLCHCVRLAWHFLQKQLVLKLLC
jgi:hypothetical protein